MAGEFAHGRACLARSGQVTLGAQTAREAERWDIGTRIRDVAADEDGQVYLLEDGDDARLLRLNRSN